LIAPTPISVAGPEQYSDDEVRSALKRVLASKQFSKAHRCAALLAYLVQRGLERDDGSSPPEHEIGMAVFGRDRMTYYTGDDPIVRVQAGRLRLRLAAYYADEGRDDAARISIPLGTYRPRVQRRAAAPDAAARPAPAALLMFRPLACLSEEPRVAGYALGLNNEMGYRLYRDLCAFRCIDPDVPLAALGPLPHAHLLEGTVRRDAARVRVSLLLRRGGDGTVVWYEQFDDAGDVTITDQEQMAERCVRALCQHLPQ